jgi:hypothetical protein
MFNIDQTKNILQEYCMKNKRPLPKYETIPINYNIPNYNVNEIKWRSSVNVNGKKYTDLSVYKNKAEAEKNIALIAILNLGIKSQTDFNIQPIDRYEHNNLNIEINNFSKLNMSDQLNISDQLNKSINKSINYSSDKLIEITEEEKKYEKKLQLTNNHLDEMDKLYKDNTRDSQIKYPTSYQLDDQLDDQLNNSNNSNNSNYVNNLVHKIGLNNLDNPLNDPLNNTSIDLIDLSNNTTTNLINNTLMKINNFYMQMKEIQFDDLFIELIKYNKKLIIYKIKPLLYLPNRLNKYIFIDIENFNFKISNQMIINLNNNSKSKYNYFIYGVCSHHSNVNPEKYNKIINIISIDSPVNEAADHLMTFIISSGLNFLNTSLDSFYIASKDKSHCILRELLIGLGFNCESIYNPEILKSYLENN